MNISVPRSPDDTSFVTQYDSFIDTKYNKNRDWSSRTTIFAIWFGTNDIIYLNRSQSNSTSSETLDNVANAMFQKADDLYNHGARHFLFLYVPTIEKAPLNKDDSLSFATADTTYLNTQIKNLGKEFWNAHQDTNVLIYDTYMEFNYIMDNKEKYGIDNITDSCENSGNSNCGTSDENFFWHNDIHPSHRVHEVLANDIHNFLTSKQVTRNLNAESAASNLNINTKSLLLWNAILLLALLFI